MSHRLNSVDATFPEDPLMSVPLELRESYDARLRELTRTLNEYKAEVEVLKRDKREKRQVTSPKNWEQLINAKSIVYRFTNSQWCYGLSKIINARNKFYQTMWATAFIFAVFVCIRIVTETLNQFQANTVITEIKTLRNQKFTFPQVTICAISSSKHNISTDSYSYEYVNEFDIQVEFCLFDGVPCKENHQIVDVFSMIGKKQKCLRFNGGYNSSGHPVPRFQQTIGNSLIGGYVVVFKQMNKSGTYKLVHINDIEEPILEQQTFLSKNQHVNIIEVEKVISEKLPLPFNECIDQEEMDNARDNLIERTLKWNKVYTQSKCFNVCFFKKVTEKLNCTYSHLYETDSDVDCIDAYFSEIYQMFTTNVFNIESTCTAECPLECHSTSYNYQKAEFLSEELVNNTFSFTISFPDLKVIKYIESPKTTYSNLISNIGGSLGLFVGIRLLSFVDILEFLFDFFLLGIYKIKAGLFRTSTGDAVSI